MRLDLISLPKVAVANGRGWGGGVWGVGGGQE